MVPLRIFLADDHEIVRYGLRSLLESQYGWSVVGEAADGREAIAKVLEIEPDVTCLDIAMPLVNGLQAAREILNHGSQTKVLILSVHDSEEIIREVIDSGALGYVLKTDAVRDLVAAVEALRSNQTFFTHKVAQVVLDRHLKRMSAHAQGPRLAAVAPLHKKPKLPS